ncbi:MAG TPA: hemolysin family protein [Thermoanaerobaculia bacterium]|nr:hemolysin family protein [Thermoanaerobaculia bacterium]
MGSSGSHVVAFVLTVVCGLLFLLFDAARHFAQQVGPVGLRRLTGDPDLEGRGRWLQFDAQNLQLVSGSLLQIGLAIGIASTVLLFDDRRVGYACLIAGVIWIGVVIVWKFVLAMFPEELDERMLKAIIPVTHFFYYAFWPLLHPLRRLVERMEREDENDADDEEVTDDQVQAYIDVGEEEGILEKSEGKMLQSIVDFGDRMARELMTPRIDVLAFDARGSIEELARLFSESKYSRIPIYQNSIDTIIGFVHIKDVYDVVLKGEKKAPADLAMPPYFVSETKKVSELLHEFQSEHLQVAVVVDEYGGTAGIITIEDIIEDIVGDISDEHEDDEATIVDLGDGEYLVSGLLRVETLEELLEADLAGDDYETVAGLIFTTLGRVPVPHTIVKKNGYQFEVDRADRRRIYRVKVSRDPEWEEDETLRIEN